jgi:uroporphyrinogen-III synthase
MSGPLAGLRVLVTRPRERRDALVEGLEAAGARVEVAPTVRIEPAPDRRPLAAAVRGLAAFDWLLVTSRSAVEALVAAGAAGTGAPPCAAVGDATAAALRAAGFTVACQPSTATAVALVDALLALGPVVGRRVLWPRADLAPEDPALALRAAGATVTDVVAYRTIPTPLPPTAAQALADGTLDVVCFASPSAVRGLLDRLPAAAAAALAGRTVAAAIGPRTADELREAGVALAVVADPHTAEGLLAALGRWAAAR